MNQAFAYNAAYTRQAGSCNVTLAQSGWKPARLVKGPLWYVVVCCQISGNCNGYLSSHQSQPHGQKYQGESRGRPLFPLELLSCTAHETSEENCCRKSTTVFFCRPFTVLPTFCTAFDVFIIRLQKAAGSA